MSLRTLAVRFGPERRAERQGGQDQLHEGIGFMENQGYHVKAGIDAVTVVSLVDQDSA